MGRTLYISQTNKPEIIRDGPSIWVKEDGKAGRRIPVRLVGRVIIIGNVMLDSGAITLFADNNIPITFMNRRTEETAIVIPYNHRLANHYKEQKMLLDSNENIAHYEKWANTKRALLQFDFIKKFLPRRFNILRKKGFGEGNYQEILKGIKKVSEEKWLVVNSVITDIFRNMIIEGLIKADLDPHIGVVHRRHNFGLALDICYIIGGESDIQTLQFFRTDEKRGFIVKENKNWFITDEGIRNIVHRFENRRSDLRGKLEKIIDELFDLMREISA